MAFFIFTAMALSFIGIYSMHTTAKDIARHDLFLIKAADNLRDILQEQDVAAAKYATLNKSEYLNQFRQYEADFLALLEIVRPDMTAPESAIITSRYRAYRHQADRIFAGDAGALDKLRKLSPLLLADLEQFETSQQVLIEARLKKADHQERQTISITLALSLTGFMLAGIVALLMMHNISKAMDKLKMATNRIGDGDFDYDPLIAEGDEIGDLAQSFTSMAVRLKDLENIAWMPAP